MVGGGDEAVELFAVDFHEGERSIDQPFEGRSVGVRDELARANVPAAQIESRAGGVGKRVADKLRYTWAGQLAYFPVDRVRRDALIYDEFAGDNHSELARRYHVSVQTIYKIIKAEKDRRQYKHLTLL